MNMNMKSIEVGIVVTIALVVIAVFFVFPDLSPFRQQISSSTSQEEQATTTSTTVSTTTTTMSTENTDQLQVLDEVVGTGATAEAGDTVTVNYVGSFTNGSVFDASANHGTTGFTFPLGAGQVIKGWDEGVAGMKVGGKRKLIVPASLGYGPQDYGPIPGNSTLVFEVELLNVKKAQ